MEIDRKGFKWKYIEKDRMREKLDETESRGSLEESARSKNVFSFFIVN
jgi:hypothetical protein